MQLTREAVFGVPWLVKSNLTVDDWLAHPSYSELSRLLSDMSPDLDLNRRVSTATLTMTIAKWARPVSLLFRLWSPASTASHQTHTRHELEHLHLNMHFRVYCWRKYP